jgi:predicted membrane-bound spermidine synthase
LKPFLIFLLVVLFFASLSTILMELALTRVFSIVLWYDYAFMAISVAFFGLGIGSLVIHIQKDSAKWKSRYERKEQLSSRIIYFAIAYAISVPAFVFLISVIPPSTSNVHLYYLVSSVPFFFAGSIMALVFYAMPQKISKLYFADLVGAASSTLLLDPLMRGFGAEYVILLTAPMVAGSAIAGALVLGKGALAGGIAVTGRLKMIAGIVLAATLLVPIVGSASAFDAFEVRPGNNKGLYYQLKDPERFEHLSTEWNSFSRIDVTRETKVNSTLNNYDSEEDSREMAAIIIDADAGTPIFRWDGTEGDLAWLQKYMDYLPYELENVDNTLVIGGGGGEDILVAIAGGSEKVTAVELNPLIVSAAKRSGEESGNLYERDDVELFIDDGRRFISSTDEKYDAIVIKLVDSWAAQLAGGYALSENYLYTTEAFQQYIRHLDEDGMLVMIRWNFELPRLMPLVADSLMKETGKSREEVSQHIMAVEERPGLFFGRNDDRETIYPVLVLVKSTPFTDAQIDLASDKAERNRAEVIMLSDQYMREPYDKLFSSAGYGEYLAQVSNPKVPTDDSPFYFAREPVPQQMIILLATVLGISAGLSVLLVWNARKKKATMDATSGFHVLFAVFIGLGFMILEITFIQRFLLLLGTPIMALTVILFSILLSSGIGAYLSGRLFAGRPYRAVFVSVPILAGVILFHFFSLQGIIDSSIAADLPSRVALTVGLLFPAGLLMGFQFPSLISMASSMKNRDNTTLLWGVNVVASIIGTVLAATLAMVIGFSGNLLFGLGTYAGAASAALLALLTIKRAQVAVMGDRQ